MLRGLAGSLQTRTKRGVASHSGEILYISLFIQPLPLTRLAFIGSVWNCEERSWSSEGSDLFWCLLEAHSAATVLRASKEEIDSKSAVSYAPRCVYLKAKDPLFSSRRRVALRPPQHVRASLPDSADFCSCCVSSLHRLQLWSSHLSLSLTAQIWRRAIKLQLVFSRPRGRDLWSLITASSDFPFR